ncbi:MAG TPA: efflux RND transporter periplasmic adaptor subunit [Anaerohalosphaeraceae bacterium]|nr:efflux RND transporter periplasmic adaptor subunit [Anaerohalosphaeraceae bacterium]
MKDKILSLVVKNKIMLIVAVMFLVGGFLLGTKSSRSNIPANAISACTDVHQEEHGHGSDEHSDNEHASVSLDELEKQNCEHNIGIVDCDECRFEVGVVRIDSAVADSLIETGSVDEINRIRKLTFTGQVQLNPTNSVEVVSTGGGRVERVEKLLGQEVKKGDVLAVIHSDDLGQAKADFLEIQSKLELAQTTFNREKGLYEKKISSQADYLTALNELKAAQASYAAADKKLRLFGLDTEQIEAVKDEKENGEFANLILRAPQDGTIIIQNISVGKMTDTSESLYTIAELSNLWVWCDVYEKDLAILHEQSSKNKPLAAKVQVKAFDEIAFEGAVDFVGNLMDEHTRTVKMRVQVKNPKNKLRPGMFADVEVAIPLPGQMLAIPQTAVMSDAGENFIFQHWKNDLWVRRDVTVGETYGNFIELLSGASQGSKIVTSGAFMLKSDVLREKMGAGCAD